MSIKLVFLFVFVYLFHVICAVDVEFTTVVHFPSTSEQSTTNLYCSWTDLPNATGPENNDGAFIIVCKLSSIAL